MNSVAIIGAGITGLTAAYKLHQKGIPVTVYESGDHAGGVIQSIRRHGYLAESGPNTILETAPEIGMLVRDLGLESRRMYTATEAEKRYLVRNRKLIALPGSPLGFFGTSLFSAGAKLRLLREPFIARAPEVKDETLAEFVQRRLGQEFLDYAINPFVAGVYAGDPHHLSVKHAFPRLYNLEQRYGSLIKGQVLGARERKRRAEVSKQDAKKFSFDEGLQVLPQTIRDQLGHDMLFNSPVTGIQQNATCWVVATPDRTGDHSAVIYTGPTYRLPEVELRTERHINCAPLSGVHYPPVATLVLGFRRDNVGHPLDGFGMLIPQREPFNILGALFSSTMFPNRAPGGHVLLTVYLGGTRAPHIATSDFDTHLNLALTDLRALLGVTGQPTFVHHAVFRHAIPQYDVGYGRFKALMDEIETKAPGLFLAGNYRDGISLADSIVSGHKAAERVQKLINGKASLVDAVQHLVAV